MNTVIEFPEWRRANPRRTLRESDTPAQVVCDFGDSMVLATARRKKFHEIMGKIDLFGSHTPAIANQESLTTLFIYAMTEELKTRKYLLHYDALQAICYIANLVTRYIVQDPEGWFMAPSITDIPTEDLSRGDAALIQYVFWERQTPHSWWIDTLQVDMIAYYAEYAETISNLPGREWDDSEMMYDELFRILPLVLDTVKTYTFPFRMMHDFGIPHASND
jgi:hypothetical protein